MSVYCSLSRPQEKIRMGKELGIGKSDERTRERKVQWGETGLTNNGQRELGLAKEPRQGDPGGGEKWDILKEESTQGLELPKAGTESGGGWGPWPVTPCIGGALLGDHTVCVTAQLWSALRCGRARTATSACSASAPPNALWHVDGGTQNHWALGPPTTP